MMKANINEIFTFQDKECLEGKIWWVADRLHPYFVKFGVQSQNVLMQVTDFKNVWAMKLSKTQIQQQKQHFANSLEMKSTKDLLTLFEGLFSASDQLATYTFTQSPHQYIEFQFKKRITIFDFRWEFTLFQVQYPCIHLICKQIINPLAFTLANQAKRLQFLKKRFEQVEKDYIRKMTQMQRNLYKSPIMEDESDWKAIMGKVEQTKKNYLVNYIKLDQSSKFFYQSYLKEEKKKQPVQIMNLITISKSKAVSRVLMESSLEASEQKIKKEMEKEKIKMKKEKKIDFL